MPRTGWQYMRFASVSLSVISRSKRALFRFNKDRSWRRIQPVIATHSLNRSAGVWKPSVLRGLSFNCLAIALSWWRAAPTTTVSWSWISNSATYPARPNGMTSSRWNGLLPALRQANGEVPRYQMQSWMAWSVRAGMSRAPVSLSSSRCSAKSKSSSKSWAATSLNETLNAIRRNVP